MSEPRVGMTVDGPVVEGEGEYILVKMPDWPPFTFDKVRWVFNETWEHAAVIAEKNKDWIVMWVQEPSSAGSS